jgi:hypothetical protein
MFKGHANGSFAEVFLVDVCCPVEVGEAILEWTKHDNGRDLMDTVRQRSKARSEARHKENRAHIMGESNLDQIVTWACLNLRETVG